MLLNFFFFSSLPSPNISFPRFCIYRHIYINEEGQQQPDIPPPRHQALLYALCSPSSSSTRSRLSLQVPVGLEGHHGRDSHVLRNSGVWGTSRWQSSIGNCNLDHCHSRAEGQNLRLGRRRRRGRRSGGVGSAGLDIDGLHDSGTGSGSFSLGDPVGLGVRRWSVWGGGCSVGFSAGGVGDTAGAGRVFVEVVGDF